MPDTLIVSNGADMGSVARLGPGIQKKPDLANNLESWLDWYEDVESGEEAKLLCPCVSSDRFGVADPN